MRGEYAGSPPHASRIVELPPRARRILEWEPAFLTTGGTTSACAENTLPQGSPPPAVRNYLRVRGEYSPSLSSHSIQAELPPRARRIHPREISGHAMPGTTSACAENTDSLSIAPPYAWNYLRVRGEYFLSPKPILRHLELPPRARRIRVSI